MGKYLVTTLSSAPNTLTESAIDWNQIDWSIIEDNVYKLQMRIAKAVQNKRYGKVKALQWLLVHSMSAKLLAVRRATAKGSKAPGIDVDAIFIRFCYRRTPQFRLTLIVMQRMTFSACLIFYPVTFNVMQHARRNVKNFLYTYLYK